MISIHSKYIKASQYLLSKHSVYFLNIGIRLFKKISNMSLSCGLKAFMATARLFFKLYNIISRFLWLKVFQCHKVSLVTLIPAYYQ